MLQLQVYSRLRFSRARICQIISSNGYHRRRTGIHIYGILVLNLIAIFRNVPLRTIQVVIRIIAERLSAITDRGESHIAAAIPAVSIHNATGPDITAMREFLRSLADVK